jgi:hypothetical protein
MEQACQLLPALVVELTDRDGSAVRFAPLLREAPRQARARMLSSRAVDRRSLSSHACASLPGSKSIDSESPPFNMTI